jgi:hypothetical protein
MILLTMSGGLESQKSSEPQAGDLTSRPHILDDHLRGATTSYLNSRPSHRFRSGTESHRL